MGKYTRDSFTDSANRKKVMIQRGVPLVDNELNEMQDILRVDLVEGQHACMSLLRATDQSPVRVPIAEGDAWKAELTTDPQVSHEVSVTEGSAFVDGYRIRFGTDVVLSVEGVAFPDTAGVEKYGFIYAEITLAEMDSTGDPTIAVANVGETSLRLVTSIQWFKSEAADWATAFSAIAALPAVTDARLWKHNTARVFVARYHRSLDAGDPSGSSFTMLDLRNGPPSEEGVKRPLFKTHRAGDAVAGEGAGATDGIVAWKASSGVLQVGYPGGAASAPTNSNLLLGGAELRTPSGPSVRLTAHDGTWARNGAANTDGSRPTQPTGMSNFTIPDGSSVGYLAKGDATNLLYARLTKTQDSNLTDTRTATQTTATISQLTVATLASFTDNPGPGTFILCTRVGNDLVWWNGHVTRGDASVVVFDDPTGGGTGVYGAVIGTRGNTTASASWALDVYLNYVTSGEGAGAFGLSRVAKAYVQRGEQYFGRGVRKYGTVLTSLSNAYDVDNNSLELEGDGFGLTRVNFSSKETTGRSAADVAECSVFAQRVVLRNLTVDSTWSTTNKPGYLLDIEAAEVILENCHFAGGVRIAANRVTVRNNTFAALGNTSAATHFGANTSVTNLVAQHLYLRSPSLAGQTRWTVENNMFSIGIDDGTHASLVLSPPALADVTVQKNQFTYDVSADNLPCSIDVRGIEGRITITRNLFWGARGVAKTGYTLAQTPPWDGLYGGSMLRRYLGADAAYGYTACAYISVVKGRSDRSSLVVEDNDFHFGYAGYGVTGRYLYWAGLAVASNYLSYPTSTVEVHHIHYKNNRHQMFADSGFGSGWALGGVTENQPALWGFYMAPQIPDGGYAIGPVGVTGYAASGIVVEGNEFDLGGHTAGVNAYRSILAAVDTRWPATGGFLPETSCPIHFSLGNLNDAPFGGAGKLYSGRSSVGLRVCGNRIYQRYVVGSAALATNLGELDNSNFEYTAGYYNGASVYPAHALVGIAVSEGAIAPTGMGDGPKDSPGRTSGTLIADNVVHHVGFLMKPRACSVGIYISMSNFEASGNKVTLPFETVVDGFPFRSRPLVVSRSSNGFVQGNFLSGGYPLAEAYRTNGGGELVATNNYLLASGDTSGVSPDLTPFAVTFTGSGSGDNKVTL